jgi:LysM repeat protein
MAPKISITGYEDSAYTQEVKSMQVSYDPKKLREHFRVKYDTSQGLGTSAVMARYDRTPPGEITFELVFDNTFDKAYYEQNALPAPSAVKDQVAEFKALVFNYQGSIHRPYYLRLSWSNQSAKGQVGSLQVSYSVFDANGDPLQALVSVVFLVTEDDKTRQARENKQSPDLTHSYLVRQGDTLPAIAHRIYGDGSYYLELARYNQLRSFRTLHPGDRLEIPPLDKLKKICWQSED